EPCSDHVLHYEVPAFGAAVEARYEAGVWTAQPVDSTLWPLLSAVLQQVDFGGPLGWRLTAHLDGVMHHGVKLGLGSSAASCVALTRFFLSLHGAPSSEEVLEAAFDAHRAFQGGRGSGADI